MSENRLHSGEYRRHLHLLYAPTLYCNLGCRYCYLGEQTARNTLRTDARRAADTLQKALDAFLRAGVLPFNVSLHGGEVTTLPPAVLDDLFSIIRHHYLDHFDALTALGYRKSSPHLKTNLFNFHKLYELFDRNRVSISASIDLPLALHERCRTSRRGKGWLGQTLDNLSLLAAYPHAKKISATLYREHTEDIPALTADIWRIHRDIGFDMNSFNFMFGFASSAAGEPVDRQIAGDEQVKFYEAMKAAFMGSELEEGLRRNWFDEFKPTYCTGSFNCGERFYLLQGDGSVWSCVRGQGVESFYYGNILEDPVDKILAAGSRRVSFVHQQQGFDSECRECPYLYLCHTGCPFVKQRNESSKSYTCALQKAIYRDNPRSYPPTAAPEERRSAAREYALEMHPGMLHGGGEFETARVPVVILPGELYEEKNALLTIISRDPLMGELYADDAFVMELNGELIPLSSQILSPRRTLHFVSPDDRVRLHIRDSLFEANCPERLRNTLYLQMLRDTPVVYGDEKRTKQEHLFTHQMYCTLLLQESIAGKGFVSTDISGLLAMHSDGFRKNVLNNLLVTTYYLREYHYQKQKANAFYHIQALNLPFQNFEFYWEKGDPANSQRYLKH